MNARALPTQLAVAKPLLEDVALTQTSSLGAVSTPG
jgi:hypothetical protein